MNIAAYLPFSLMEYPGKVATLVFTQGCNFSCGFCHNPKLIDHGVSHVYSEAEFFAFLASRQGKLQAVVISGGEPTLQAGLMLFLSAIRKMGFAIKLDTNGSKPEVLTELINAHLVDYIAMDIKAPLEKYSLISPGFCNSDNIAASIRLLLNTPELDHEFRTTAIKPWLSQEDLLTCGLWVRGARRYFLQPFMAHQAWLPDFQEMESYSPAELLAIRERLLHLGVNCLVRL